MPFENVGLGSSQTYSGSSDFYIADSYLLRRDDSKTPPRMDRGLLGPFDGRWSEKFPPALASYTASGFTDPVMSWTYNYVAQLP